MAGPDRILHLLLYPFPGSSHTIPILDLAHRLLARPGITITILVTPGNLPLLQPLLAAHPHPSLQPLILPAPPPPPTSTGTGPLNRVGIRVGEGTMNIPEAVELARILTDSVNGARPERVRAKEISIAALSAMKPEGSSDHDLDDFVKRISEVKMSK
ncbi:hypothetical protein CRG98_035768 [Punica granatum]|uniref:Uncharacterized protein n=1 Tax=Punica granatum TaxID=22663 RepID=A0A2I0IIX8_PUNGR|nr:hypothetical protein CRG98_035768 [Punica granatum]